MKTVLIILGAMVLYVGVEFAILYYRENHLPQLPATNISDTVLGSGPALRYIAAGDSTGVGRGASGPNKTYTYQVAQYLAKNHTVEYRNISVIGYKSADVLESQIQQI